MDKLYYNAKIDQLIRQAYSALSPDTPSKYGEETADELAKAEFIALMRAEGKRDPSFQEQVVREAVHAEVLRYLEEHRPTGSYNVDKMFPISETNWVKMPAATKEHLLAWASLESDPDNREYIESRLIHWNDTKHSTLADVEQSLAEEVPW
jgi:hypothetical protein